MAKCKYCGRGKNEGLPTKPRTINMTDELWAKVGEIQKFMGAASKAAVVVRLVEEAEC